MSKQELLNKFYDDEYETITLDDLMTMAYFYGIEINCVIKSPVYNIHVSNNVCSEIGRIYKMLTCRNLIAGNKTFVDLCKAFKDIHTSIMFK